MDLRDLNFSVGGGYFYQYTVGAYLVYLMTFIDKESLFTDNKETFELIKDTIITSFGENFKEKDLDVIFEGNGKCFEDINILSKKRDEKTNVIFVQVKGGNEGGTRKAINSREDRVKIILNFLNNQNIYITGNGTKYIIISNIGINHNMGIIFNKTPDLDVLGNVICGDVETYLKKEKIKYKTTKVKLLHSYIMKIIKGEEGGNEKIYGRNQPLGRKSDQEIIRELIENLLIIAKHRVVLIDKLKFGKILDTLFKIAPEKKVEKDIFSVQAMSIDSKKIQTKTQDKKNERYFIYNDIYLTEKNGSFFRVEDIDFIKEGKIMKMN